MGRGLKTPKARIPQVVVTAEAKKALMLWLESTPLKIQQGQVVSSLIHYFLKQKPYVQSAILSRIDVGMEGAYSEALARLSLELHQKAGGSPSYAGQVTFVPAVSPQTPEKPTAPQSTVAGSGKSSR